MNKFYFILFALALVKYVILFASVRGKSSIRVAVNTNELRDEVKKNPDAEASGDIIISNMKPTLMELINRGEARVEFFDDFVLTLTWGAQPTT